MKWFKIHTNIKKKKFNLKNLIVNSFFYENEIKQKLSKREYGTVYQAQRRTTFFLRILK